MRRLAAALLAAAACRGASAQAVPADDDPLGLTPPPVAVTIPGDWRPLPEVAGTGDAAARAAAGRRAVFSVRSWGEPGIGCFATQVDVAGARAATLAQVAEDLRGVLAGSLGLAEWAFTDGQIAELAGTIAHGAMRGRVRGRLAIDGTGLPHAVVAACFYNRRDPARCADLCTRLLATLEAPKVTP